MCGELQADDEVFDFRQDVMFCEVLCEVSSVSSEEASEEKREKTWEEEEDDDDEEFDAKFDTLIPIRSALGVISLPICESVDEKEEATLPKDGVLYRCDRRDDMGGI